MNTTDTIRTLLNTKATLQAKIKANAFDGNIEIKTIHDERYIYIRKRVLGKYTSTYVDKYSEELYALAVNQAQQMRSLKKELRGVEKELAKLGYAENEVSPRVRLNIDFARSNMKTLIYDQAVLEGVSTTFPQTETILDNGEVHGVKMMDILKILGLKHAWEFILDTDVTTSRTDVYLLSHIARLINEGFYENGGAIRTVPVAIGGSTYIPPIPNEEKIKEDLRSIIDSSKEAIEKAIDLILYCMKSQIFIDGNKRASIIFANQYLIQNGLGVLVIPEKLVAEFKGLLIAYYEGKDEKKIRAFLKEKCWKQF